MSTSVVRHPGEFRWETRLLGVTTLVLTVIGIATCYASGTYLTDWYHQATLQAVAALGGAVVFFVAASLDYHWWQRLALPLFLATLIGLVLLTMVQLIWPGRQAHGALASLFPMVQGAHRTIRVGVPVQVSEIARFTLAAWLAAHAAQLGSKVRDFQHGFLPLIGVLTITTVLVAREPSVSMAIVLGVIGGAVIFTAGARVPHVALVALIAGLAVLLILKIDRVRSGRANVFHTAAIACEVQEQACESLIGFGNGGWFGVGYERGTQKLGHLPEADSDFLLSLVGEEWGLAGVALVALGFAVFCAMGFRIARTARDPFGVYLAAGLTVAVGITAFMHAAVVTRLMPTTGLTLPFMSIGRVSLILYLFSAGVIVSIGRSRGRPARST